MVNSSGIKLDTMHGEWIDVETPRDSFDADLQRERFAEYEPPALDTDAQEAFNRICERAHEDSEQRADEILGNAIGETPERRSELIKEALAEINGYRRGQLSLDEWLARPGHITRLDERRRADLHYQARALKAYGPVLLADSRVSPQAFEALLRRMMELSRAFPAAETVEE